MTGRAQRMDDPTPSYDDANLANLAAELEVRLTGRSPTRGLPPDWPS